ncbi:hypothetical protein ACWEO6_28215 [Streptomyces sp. NPDC004291]
MVTTPHEPPVHPAHPVYVIDSVRGLEAGGSLAARVKGAGLLAATLLSAAAAPPRVIPPPLLVTLRDLRTMWNPGKRRSRFVR